MTRSQHGWRVEKSANWHVSRNHRHGTETILTAFGLAGLILIRRGASGNKYEQETEDGGMTVTAA